MIKLALKIHPNNSKIYLLFINPITLTLLLNTLGTNDLYIQKVEK